MRYMIEPIGSQFGPRDIARLAEFFTGRSTDGYRLHSVFEVTQPPGCVVFGQPTRTYLAVFERPD